MQTGVATEGSTLDPGRAARLRDPGLMPETVEVRGRRYTLQEPVGFGLKGVVWRVSDEYGRNRALKLATPGDYQDRSYLQEIHRARDLENHEQFAQLHDAESITLPVGGQETALIAFVEEWVEGRTLRQILRDTPDQITETFVTGYLDELCGALNVLRVLGLQHGDLHPGNVMIADPAPGTLDKRMRVRVVDMGSLRPLPEQPVDRLSDHTNLVRHLVDMHNAMRRNPSVSHRTARFLTSCRQLISSMLDADASIALTSPEQIAVSFKQAYVRSMFPVRSASIKLNDPFEFISAEHLADDRLLVDIFARSCPWLSKVQSSVPCLLVGPRGCGKSTMFRWLSLRAHLHKTELDRDDFTLSGFYVACTAMQNRLSWVRSDDLSNRFHREIVHYLNMLLAREVMHTLSMIAERADRTKLWGFGDPQESSIYAFVSAAVAGPLPVLQGVSRSRVGLELVERELSRCHDAMRRGINLENITDESFLGDFTEHLLREVPFFADKPIAFLLDDYSTHRLPARVQRILNRVIWQRRSSHLFKLSSEKYGAELVDVEGAAIDTTRELVEIDCGREFLRLNDAEARAFAVELLSKRLESAEYVGKPEQLLGSSRWEEGSLAAALRSRRRGRADDQYYGLECIANICSGDISTLLLVIRRIFDLGEVSKSTVSTVPRVKQHQAIESVSRELLEKVRHHHRYGPQMYAILLAFGQHVRKVLVNGRPHSNSALPQICRIEVDDFGSAKDALSAEQEELATELIRRAIFIEMEPGRSRRGFAPTLRWQLRRVYLPAFKAALAKNDAVKFTPAEFKFFLTDPTAACDLDWRRRRKDDNAEPLFD